MSNIFVISSCLKPKVGMIDHEIRYTQTLNTIITKEYSNSYGEPYYPILNDKNLELFKKYKELSIIETKKNNIHFIGRLANYKYFNMDQAIKNSLDYFNNYLHH